MIFKFKVLFHLVSFKVLKFIFKNKIHVLQSIRWKKLKKNLSNSSFYNKAIKSNLALKEYPLMNKEKFMSNFDSLNTKGITLFEANKVALKAEKERDFAPTINNITIGLSSGTSGNRGVFLASENERAKWVATILDRVIGFSLRKRKVAFFLRANSNLYESVKSKLLVFRFFDLLIPLESHLKKLNLLQPNILVAQPSLLMQLAKEKQLGNLSISPNKIISIAEVLYPEDNNYLEKIFQQKIHQVYQCTEGFLAHTCSKGTLHFNEDFLIIEKKYVDRKKERYHPIITDLMRTSQPVIRYELNDIILDNKTCLCGLKTIAIKRIEGRSDDILCFEDENKKIVKIFPDFIRRAIITSNEEINNYYLTQNNLDTLSLYIEGSNEMFTKAKNEILNLLAKRNIQNVKVNRLKSYKLIPGEKLRRIKNAIRKKN